MTKVTSHGISQIVGGKEIVAAGLQIKIVSIDVNAHGQQFAHVAANLVDNKGASLVQLVDVELGVGNVVTLLNLDKAFEITVSA